MMNPISAPKCPDCSTILLSKENGFFRCWKCHWIGENPISALPQAPRLETLCTVRFVRIEQDVVPEMHPCNPSLAWHEDRLWMTVRFVDYVLEAPGVGPFSSRTFFREIDPSLSNVRLGDDTMALIEPPASPYKVHVRGYEDVRLFSYRGRMRGIACACEHNRQARPEQVTFDVDLDDGEVVRPRIHKSPLSEKNWLPLVEPDRLLFVYSLRPTTIILDDECREIYRHACPEATSPGDPLLSGGSQAVPFLGGYLLIAHERYRMGSQYYLHRFVHLNDRLQIRTISRRFSFRHHGVEFCAGLAPAGDRMIASFGVDDREAWLCEISNADIERMLYGPRTGESKR